MRSLRLLRIQLGSEYARPSPFQIRQLVRFTTIIRWPGLAFVGIVGLVAPPPVPVLLAFLIIWVAAYNGWAMQLITQASDASALRIGRVLTLLDEVTYFALLAIFAGFPPSAVFACYLILLMEAVAYDGAEGAMLSVALFVIGMAAYQGSRMVFYGLPFATADLLLWSLITVVAGAVLAAIDRILLSGGQAEAVSPIDSPRATAPTPGVRLSRREQEVLQLVAEGYSNTMIATRLHVSENTVKTYMENLLTRLNARNRAEAVAAASRLNLL